MTFLFLRAGSRTPTPTRPAQPLSPGWPEIVVSLVGLTGLGLGSQLWRLAHPLVDYGPIFIALSGLIAIGAGGRKGRVIEPLARR